MSIYRPIQSAEDHPSLATAIGDVILAWTEAESIQVAMLAAMLNVPHHKGSQLYHQIPNFRARTKTLYAMATVTEGFDELTPFIARFSRLSKTRNEIVHGAFIQEWGGTELRRVRLDEPIGSKNRSIITKPNDIKQHADAVRGVVREFQEAGNLIPAYKAWLGPHPTETEGQRRLGPPK